MGLEEVKQGLKEELEERREIILEEARRRKEELEKEAKQEIETYREKKEKDAENLIKNLERSELATTKLQSKKKRLSVKKDAIDNSFRQVMDKLVSKKPKQREEIIEALIEKAEDEIDVGKIFCASKDKKLIENYEVETSDDIEGGIVCESKDGQSRVDYTIESLLVEIREETLKEVEEKLFQND